MKSNLILIAAFFLIVLSFMACETASKPNTTTSVTNVIDTIGCIIHEEREGVIIKRTLASCALECIDRYRKEIDSLKVGNPNFPNIENLLVRGTYVSFSSLKTILINSKFNAQDSLFAMLGAMPDGSTEIVFALKKEDMKREDIAYYNFTQPCPDACPW